MKRWQPGDSIALREVYQARVWALRAVRVVEDTPDRVVVYMAPGNRWKRPESADGRPLRLQQASWALADTTWTGNAALRIFEPGRAHSVLVWWDSVTWEFQGWYVNLEEPVRRTSIGFDYLDQVLDIVVSPNRQWHWKDEDELAIAVERELISPALAAEIRAEGQRVIPMIEAGLPPFDREWVHWRAPADWGPADPPAGWELD